MHKTKLERFIVGCVTIVLMSSAGCDQIQSLFSGNKKAASAPAQNKPTVSSPAADPNAPLPANVLAKVGNWTITTDEFKDRLANLKQALPEYNIDDPQSKKLILDELIRQELLVEEAQQAGVGNKKEITDAIDEFRRSLLVREIAVGLTKNISVSDQEAQDFYNQNKDKMKDPAEYHLREIVVDNYEAAKNILAEILKGANFAETAKTRSKGASAAQGGDLGFVKAFNSPELEKAVSSLEVGEVSGVLKSPDGFSVVKLEEKKGGAQLEFSTVKNEITAYLTQLKQQQAILDHIEQLKQKTQVKVNEGLL